MRIHGGKLFEPPKDGKPIAEGYPLPCVNHPEERERTLAIFKKHMERKRQPEGAFSHFAVAWVISRSARLRKSPAGIAKVSQRFARAIFMPKQRPSRSRSGPPIPALLATMSC